MCLSTYHDLDIDSDCDNIRIQMTDTVLKVGCGMDSAQVHALACLMYSEVWPITAPKAALYISACHRAQALACVSCRVLIGGASRRAFIGCYCSAATK